MLDRESARDMLRAAEEEPRDAALAIAWEVLHAIDGLASPDVCTAAVELILRKASEAEILARWGKVPASVRRNISYSTSSSKGLGIDSVEELFRRPETGVHERHLLVAGLARTAAERGQVGRILRLLDRIGKYPDSEARQRTLEKFQASARAALGVPRSA